MRKFLFFFILLAITAACDDSPEPLPEEPMPPASADTLMWDGTAYTDGLLRYGLLADTAVQLLPPDTAHVSLPAELTVPATVRIHDREYPVVQVGFGCFSDCNALERVHLPATMRSIEPGGFWSCHGLTEITMPESVSYIGEEAFAFCTAFTTFHLPAGLTRLDRCVLSDCDRLEEIDIPASVTHIEVGAFSGCDSLKHVTIPQAVTWLEYSAFAGCRTLKSVIFQGPANLGIKAFTVCPALEEIHCQSTTPAEYVDATSFDADTYSRVTLYVPTSATSAYAAHPQWGKFRIVGE